MAEDGWFQDQVEVISRCVLRAAAYRYAAGGKWLAAIACKATYRLIPGVAELHPEQDDVVGRDRHYRDDPKQSLLWPSDLVPPKPYADVILIGDAFAPGGKPAQSLVVRLRVGGMEKSLEVCGERGFTKDGALHQGLPFIKMPLRYENAAGGPATWNPVGVPQGAEPDARGLIRLPPIQPVGVQVTSPDAPIAPIGFGPIAASWPIRLSRLGAFAAQLPDGQWSGQPLPKQLDHGFFSCAPADQQVFLLSDNLRIVLENLHPDHPQLVTELQSVCPAVSLERGGKRPQEVGLKADTLLIDTRRGICTMVWRGLVLLREAQERCRLVVTMTTRPGCSTLVGLGPDSAPGSGAPRSQPDDGAAARPPRPTWPRSLPEEETTATQLLPPSYRRGAAAGAGETPPLQELTSAAIAEHPSGARSETQPLGPLLQGLSEGLSRQQIREQLSQAVPFKPDAAQAPLPPAGTDPSSTCRLRRVTPTSVMSPLAEPQEASSRAMPFVGGAASPPPSAGVSAVLRAAHPQAAGGLGDAAIADPAAAAGAGRPRYPLRAQLCYGRANGGPAGQLATGRDLVSDPWRRAFAEPAVVGASAVAGRSVRARLSAPPYLSGSQAGDP